MSYYHPGAYMVLPADTVYFITTTVIDWVDVFTRDEYKNIIAESLHFCRCKKGLCIYAWVLMTNHLHLIVSHDVDNEHLAKTIGDFKKFTAKKVIQAIIDNPQESRKQWMLEHFKEENINKNRDASCSKSKTNSGKYVPVADRIVGNSSTAEAVGCKPTATKTTATNDGNGSVLAGLQPASVLCRPSQLPAVGCKPTATKTNLENTAIKQAAKEDTHYHLWQRGYDSYCIYNIKHLRQKIDYLHANPVRAGIVDNPLYYRYCSYPNYCGEQGLFEIDLIDMGLSDPTCPPKWWE